MVDHQLWQAQWLFKSKPIARGSFKLQHYKHFPIINNFLFIWGFVCLWKCHQYTNLETEQCGQLNSVVTDSHNYSSVLSDTLTDLLGADAFKGGRGEKRKGLPKAQTITKKLSAAFAALSYRIILPFFEL